MILQNENELHLIMRNGTQEKVLARCAFEYELDKDYRMKLWVKGDVIKGFVDGVEVIHASDQTFKEGGCGFLIDRGTCMADNLVISDLSGERE